MSKRLIGAAGLGLAFALGGAGAAFAADPLKVGVLATLEGTYTVLGEDGVRGFNVALKKFGGMAGGREVEVVIGATDASPDSAIRAARKVVEQDKVDIVIGPLSGSEGIAIKDYAKTQPQVTFINGISGAQETTYVDPAPNFFRFNMDGAQWSSGIGEYIYNEKGYRTIATIGEDYSFIYTQVFGLVLEFCGLGGEVTERHWVPLGTKGLRVHHRRAARGRGCDLPRTRRRRRGELPQPVPPGRRRRGARRRYDHGRSDRALVEGAGQEGPDRDPGLRAAGR